MQRRIQRMRKLYSTQELFKCRYWSLFMAKAPLYGKGFADVPLEKTAYVNVVIIVIAVRRIELFRYRNIPRRAIHGRIWLRLRHRADQSIAAHICRFGFLPLDSSWNAGVGKNRCPRLQKSQKLCYAVEPV